MIQTYARINTGSQIGAYKVYIPSTTFSDTPMVTITIKEDWLIIKRAKPSERGLKMQMYNKKTETRCIWFRFHEYTLKRRLYPIDIDSSDDDEVWIDLSKAKL